MHPDLASRFHLAARLVPDSRDWRLLVDSEPRFSTVAALDQPRNAKRSPARIALSPRRSLAAERAPTDPPTLAVADRPAAGPAEDTLPAEMCAALDSLLETVGKTASPASVELVMRAAQLAIESHQAETRQSGEPYAMHPIAVATILAHMQLDAETVAAALLHDVIEDTPITLERASLNSVGEWRDWWMG